MSVAKGYALERSEKAWNLERGVHISTVISLKCILICERAIHYLPARVSITDLPFVIVFCSPMITAGAVFSVNVPFSALAQCIVTKDLFEFFFIKGWIIISVY